MNKNELQKQKKLTFTPYFSPDGKDPFDTVEWEKRSAKIGNIKGDVIFEQDNIDVPKEWTQNATNIVASKYFYGDDSKGLRENSVKQLIDRVTRTMTEWGDVDGYFADEESKETFYNELSWLILHQYGTFNSPVWFNAGVHRYDKGNSKGRYHWDKANQRVVEAEDDYTFPQCSACFILSVDDNMDSILSLVKTEGMIFKFGSGTGINMSSLRSSKEKITGGGQASGPVSFMKGFDAFAGIIKSGGKTRRAAKMVMLNVEHPDIVEFIDAKVTEEKKAWDLIDAGYDGSIDGEAYTSVYYQNANHSVRITDEFMDAIENDGMYSTKAVDGGFEIEKLRARDILRKISEATYVCGDPGVQYDTTINNWHTCANTDRIHGSNPCSEYMFLNDTACNLASLNLMKFRKPNGSFDVERFEKAVRIFTTAMDIIIDNASYPSQPMVKNSHLYRTLGLGFANIGALLMSKGLAYDSDEGRALAASISALMTGVSYHQSTILSENMGSFEGYAENKEPVLKVMKQHRDAVSDIDSRYVETDLLERVKVIWDDVVRRTQTYGLRNAQATVLAPTGTIAFMMDCDTTGVEPDIALVKFKKLVGGGTIKIVNNTVEMALGELGYSDDEVKRIREHIDNNDTIEGAPDLKTKHLPIFDCAFKPANGTRTIHHMGHIKMMGAIQPFISGAISKTVNMPNDANVDEIMNAYIEGWKQGLKALAIYRDGSKRIQPLNAGKEKAEKKVEKNIETEYKVVYKPVRTKLPDERRSVTHKFVIAGHTGYITVGLYPDGKPGEIFVTIAKDGSVISGLMDSFATAISLSLQYGVPLEVLVNQYVHRRFEPSGFTSNPNIRIAKSFVDYIFRWMAIKFLSREKAEAVGINVIPEDAKTSEEKDSYDSDYLSTKDAKDPKEATKEEEDKKFTFDNQSDAPACDTCGEIMVRNGSCYKCFNCGATSGCS